MDDIKGIYLRVLDTPAPPLAEATVVLANARDATRKRRRLHTALGGSLAAAMLVTAFVTIDRPRDPAYPQPWLIATGAPSPVSRPVEWPPMPTPQEAHAHGPAIVELLIALVPQAEIKELSNPRTLSPTSTWSQIDETKWGSIDELSEAPYFSSTVVKIGAPGAAGRLTATLIADGQRPSTVDFCTDAVKARLALRLTQAGLAGATCEVVYIRGVPIRISTAKVGKQDLWMSATRFMDGGFVNVEWVQGMEFLITDNERWWRPHMVIREGAWPDLSDRTRPPVTLQRLADLAANPELLP